MADDKNKKATMSKSADPPQDIPIFLRKTYHMVDSCDPSIACWSEDGETFVVKDPTKFERTIIPQFFKHSKFSSFVRQLNFYAFRKIKYVDTIRIDPKLEAETANYWRFRHEKFQRGKPHLLSEIKRMNGQKGLKGAAATSTAAPSGNGTAGDKSKGSSENSEALKSELDTLKKRIEDMTKNMDELTSLVQKVSLKQEEPENCAPVGNKRKKVSDADLVVSKSEEPVAAPLALDIRPDEMLSMDLDEDFNFSSPMALPPAPELLERETSAVSDEDFVDKLFTVFANPEDSLLDTLSDDEPSQVVLPKKETILPDVTVSKPKMEVQEKHQRRNRPDPQLMDRLSEALAVLPKEMQESIVDRLINSITSTDLLAQPADRVEATPEIKKDEMMVVDTTVENPPVPPAMPLAAATLAALLSHYSAALKDSKRSPNVKTIPVIPVHA